MTAMTEIARLRAALVAAGNAIFNLKQGVKLPDNFTEQMERLSAQIDEALAAPADAVGEPIPVRLYCPSCRRPHIDRDEWATRPHRVHKCEHCGLEWRAANVPTVGVEAIELNKGLPDE